MMKKNRYFLLKTIFFTFFLISVTLLFRNCFTESKYDKEFDQVNGEIVVLFNQKVNLEELSTVKDTFHTPVEIVRHMDDYILLKVKNKEGYREVMEKLKKNPTVEAVQANYSITSMLLNNDKYADTQWAINNPGYFATYSNMGRRYLSSKTDIDMDVYEAWDNIKLQNQERREVVVAIIDTGVDYKHPDLAEHMWKNTKEIPDDGIDNDQNGFIDDVYGWDFYNGDASVCHYEYDEEYDMEFSDTFDKDDHGTHVAGIIGAVTNNKIGIAGAASNIDIKLMALKINGGTDGSGNISNAVEAIKYATMMGADIGNMSWGTSEYSKALEKVMKESDMLFVTAAGNSGSDNDKKPVYPANMKLDNLISVSYIDAYGKLAKLSNYGANTVDLAAPGEHILSTVVGSYDFMSGTSMAAPQVSAVAALVYSYSDKVYPQNVKKIILNNLKSIEELDGKLRYAGIPNANKAVAGADSLMVDDAPPVISLDTIYNKGEIIIPFHAEDEGGSGIRVIRWINGKKNLTYFKHGIGGLEPGNRGKLILSKAGSYTFFVSDYAGNESVYNYNVKDDTTPPKVTSSYKVSASYKYRTVSVKINDSQSGIKRVKYMQGKKTVKDFLPAGTGTEISLKDGNGTFKVNKDGIYSIYVVDNRGNKLVKQIEIKTIKATNIKFSIKKKTIKMGEKYSLKTSTMPSNTTDPVTYTSSNRKVAIVSKSGKITALKYGKATITAVTASGKKTECIINVIKK